MALKSYSYSAMQSYLMCGFQMKCHYIDGIPGKANGNLIRGNAYHNGLGMALSERVVFGTTMPTQQVIDVYNKTWENSLKRKSADEEGRMVEMRDIDFGGDDPETVRVGGEVILRKYYEEYAPKLQPREVEVYKRTNYRGIPLTGKIDIITMDYKFIDHKTSEKTLGEQDFAKEFQSCFYAILDNRDELDFELHQAVIKKEPEIKVWQKHCSKTDVKWVGDLIVQTWECIQKGIFLPTGIGSYICGPKACYFWDICHRKELPAKRPTIDDF